MDELVRTPNTTRDLSAAGCVRLLATRWWLSDRCAGFSDAGLLFRRPITSPTIH